jgi:PIN domain nuclease of toxin-antitoxin system
MRLLLDTQLLIWATARSARVPETARAMILDEGNMLTFSPISIWEVAIKTSLGKDDFQVDPAVLRRALLDAGYEETPVTGEHAVAVQALPTIHKDPFDRMLIAQAIIDGAMLLSTDGSMARYGSPVRRV